MSIASVHWLTAEREYTRLNGVGYRAKCSCGWRAKNRAPTEEAAVKRARRHVPGAELGVVQGGLF